MADATEGASADPQITFKVKTSGDKQHTITMSESALVSDLKAKLAGADYEDIPADRQRLIYSGRVMKNEETLATYKIKSGNTVHLVKSAASNPAPQPAASSTAVPAVPQVPTNMAAGTANNPLAGLTGARYAGLTNLPSADMFGPDGGMVGSMMDEDQLANMMSNPNVAQQMNEMMNNDQFLDLMIQSNPMLRDNPNARQLVRMPWFRQMMTNPEALRSAAQMQRLMRGGNNGQGSFPMPGVTDTTPGQGNNDAGNTGAQAPAFDPSALFGALGGGAGAGADPLAALRSLMGTPPTTGTPRTENPAASNTTSNNTPSSPPTGASSPPPNPFASLFGAPNPNAATNPFGMPPMDPEAMQQLAQLLGSGSGGFGAPAAPPDNRPPEERYAEQLRQLNDMGFYDFDRNVAALRRSGGSVQGAIEHLLSS
ncbi:ubiquitin-domain-containing protein [Xylariaceae sp. FL1272]|nr:ubiquitin-domain-containing protein [Xylariaceae sp. FL1272]